MRSLKKKKLICFLLALAMALSYVTFAFASADEKQSELDDINNEIDERKGRITANENMISELSKQRA